MKVCRAIERCKDIMLQIERPFVIGGIREGFHIPWPVELDLIEQVVFIQYRLTGDKQLVSKMEGTLEQRSVTGNIAMLFSVYLL